MVLEASQYHKTRTPKHPSISALNLSDVGGTPGASYYLFGAPSLRTLCYNALVHFSIQTYVHIFVYFWFLGQSSVHSKVTHNMQGTYMGNWGSNSGWPCSGKMPYQLYYYSSSNFYAFLWGYFTPTFMCMSYLIMWTQTITHIYMCTDKCFITDATFCTSSHICSTFFNPLLFCVWRCLIKPQSMKDHSDRIWSPSVLISIFPGLLMMCALELAGGRAGVQCRK